MDLGAGSGLGIRTIAGILPDAHIVAVEPSPIQRAALFARIGSDPDLRERVTVIAADAEHAALPDRLGGVVAMNMTGASQMLSGSLCGTAPRWFWTGTR